MKTNKTTQRRGAKNGDETSLKKIRVRTLYDAQLDGKYFIESAIVPVPGDVVRIDGVDNVVDYRFYPVNEGQPVIPELFISKRNGKVNY